MKQILSVFTTISLMFLQVCTGVRSCVIWSSAGQVVQRSSTFRVYCTFSFRCRHSMYSGHPPQAQSHLEHNSSTIYLEVVNLMEDRTFSCDCSTNDRNSHNIPDSCGLDISAGYPPNPPDNFSCVYPVAAARPTSNVVCSWSSGRETYLRNNPRLWVRTCNGTGASDPFIVATEGRTFADFPVDDSVQTVSVQVQVQNQLGSASSSVLNYTLTDIVKPPAPDHLQVECSSRSCRINMTQFMTQHLEIIYRRGERDWTSSPDAVVKDAVVHVPSLEPYGSYHFRARSRFRTGLWSDWSDAVSSWTQEEVPAKALDVWYTADRSLKSMRVFWKEADISSARGKILDYTVLLSSTNSTLTFNVSYTERSLSAPFCADCVVTVRARNSKGLSPPASVPTLNREAEPPVVHVSKNKQNIAIYWRETGSASPPVQYVVEWYPQGQRLEQLRWVRMGGNSSHVVLTDLKPFVCYDGAVFVFYGDGSVGAEPFRDVGTAVAAPSVGPSVQERVEGDTLSLSWAEIPGSQRGGCITHYTVYLENTSGYHQASYNISRSQRFWVKRALPPAVYSVWMSASTAAGEGRPGQKIKFFIQQDSQLTLVLIVGGLVAVGFVVLCLYQISAVKQRVCLMLGVIPDPANSKWAKECLREKQGKVDLHLQLSTSTTMEEEEPILVDIQELPKQPPDSSFSSSLLVRFNSTDSDLPSPVYPATTYIKSLSHDSDSSDNTQVSLDTAETVDYISSHGTDDMFPDEDDEDMPCFFPSHGVFSEPAPFVAKLTLDAVRINGGELFIQ